MGIESQLCKLKRVTVIGGGDGGGGGDTITGMYLAPLNRTLKSS